MDDAEIFKSSLGSVLHFLCHNCVIIFLTMVCINDDPESIQELSCRIHKPYFILI